MSLNNSIPANFNEICRTCLKGGQLLTYLYDEENTINLVKKLESCTALRFDKNDQMPNKICPTCIEELLQAYNFINKCQISDATLKKYLLNESRVILKIEDVEANETIKLEHNNEKVEENYDLVSEISFKDELIDDASEINVEKRKSKFEGYVVDSGVRKSASDSDSVLNNETVDENYDLISEISSKSELTDDRSEINAEKRKSEFEGYVVDSGVKNTASDSVLNNETVDEDFVSDVSLYDDTTEVNTKKRKRGDEDIVGYVDVKKPASDSDNVLINATSLNNTFCVGESEIPSPVLRKTRSEIGKENFAKKPKPKGSVRATLSYKRRKTMKYCPVCHKRFGNVAGLLTHMQSHTESDVHLNERAHSSKTKLTKHKTKENQCQICRKDVTDASQLLSHYKQHINEHKCEFCSQIYTLTNLRKHILKKHTGMRPYFCEMCHEKFPDIDALKSHKSLSHSSEKSHRCTICFYTFDTLTELKDHAFVHVEGVPFTCQTCEEEFEDAQCLIAHKFDEKCGKFYVCGNCPKIFQLVKLKFIHRITCN